MAGFFEALISEHKDGQIVSCGLYLPQNQAYDAIQLSSLIAKKFKVEFVLNNNTRPPFVRLYETVFPLPNVIKVINTLKEICSNMVKFSIKWGSFEVEEHNIVLWGEQNEAIDLFHELVLTELNPLRKGYYKQKYQYGKQPFLAEEKESLLKWGTPWAKNYLPHMIIAKSLEKFSVSDLLDLEWYNKTCTFPGVIIGIKNPHGGLKQFQKFDFKS